MYAYTRDSEGHYTAWIGGRQITAHTKDQLNRLMDAAEKDLHKRNIERRREEQRKAILGRKDRRSTYSTVARLRNVWV